MKLLLLTAFIAAVTASPVAQVSENWPWHVGKVYHYDVYSHALNNYEEGISHGSAYKAQFTVTVKAPGLLIAKLENSLYATVKAHIYDNFDLPSDLNYAPLPVMDQYFEIVVDGGRVVSLNVPSKLPFTYVNFLKGLVGALQVDLTPYNYVKNYPNSFDKNTFQGLFKKMETDVTGQCETLYSVSPMASEWRREFTKFVPEEDPIEIVKSKNYGVCDTHVHVQFGVPEGSLVQGIAQDNEDHQMIKHTFEGRFLVGKQGPIYKAEAMSTVFVSPLISGKQKAEVISYVKFYLNSVENDNSAEYKSKADVLSSTENLLYVTGNLSIFDHGDEQAVAKAQLLLQEMAPLLQNPNNIPKGNFLLKFNFLAHMLGSFNSKQLTQMTESIEISKASKNIAKNGMWSIYRDALAEAGTKEAYEHIKSWVLNKKIEGQEASDVISVMGRSLFNCSEELLKDFFKFAIDPVVVELKFVNNSALLASSKLLRKAKADHYILETVIPYFEKELKEAITKEETGKALVYVTVLGNLGHQNVLKVFAPYLEGHVPVSKYIRTQMVINLKTLAYYQNDYVRVVLYSIVRNTGEVYEVRVAAALNLFLAIPTPEMMQVLAHMTHVDPSTQVRAVLTNSITTAAELKDPLFYELAKIAQSVLDMITKETFDSMYSTNVVLEEYIGEHDYNYFSILSAIASDNSFLPKYLSTAFSFRGTGQNEESEVSFSVSDVQEFLSFFVQNIYEPKRTHPEFKFSAKKIIDLLNIKRGPREHLEGALFIDDMNLQKLFTFNEKDLFAFIADAGKSIAKLVDGIDYHYTKVLYLKNTKVSFPLANGMPFLFEYGEPTLVMANVHMEVKMDHNSKDLAGSLNTNIDFTQSQAVQCAISFKDIFGDQFTISGVLSELQVYVPLKINAEYNDGLFKVHFEPLYADKDINLIQFDVIPHTGVYKQNAIKYDMVPFKRPTKTGSIDFKFGYLTGMVYQVQGHTYSSDYKDLEKLFTDDFWTNFGRMIYQKDIANTHFSFKYLSKDSKVKSTSFTVYFDTLYNQKNSGKMGPASVTKYVEPHSVSRREEIVKKVSTGIESATVQLVDFSAEFEGPKKAVFVFTGAYAYSDVDPKMQAAIFAHNTEQINAVFKVEPETHKLNTLNFEEALKNDVKVTYEANIKYQNADFHLQGYGKRSEEYTELLKNDPMAKKCLDDISKKNFFQKDCYNMTLKAYAPDYFKATVSFKEVDPNFYSLTGYTYNEYVKPAFDFDVDSDLSEKTTGDKMEIETQIYYYDNYANYKLTTNNGSFSLENVEITWDFPYIMSFYTPIYTLEDWTDAFTGYESKVYCAVDDNKVSTFSGRSYEYALTSSWHVVMVDDSEDLGKSLVILARRPSEKQAEVYVSYKTEGGKFFELTIKPDNIDVKSNAKKTCEGALTMYFDDAEDVPLLEYYSLGKDIYAFDIEDKNIRIVYDKHRLVVFTEEYYGLTMGLCGKSSTELRDDFLTPFGLVDLPEHYGASFSIDGEFSDPKTVQLKKEAKVKAYQLVTKYTTILSADFDWNKSLNETPKHFCDKKM